MAEIKNHGLVQVYTGDGKGKTTAAFGLAMRASGKGLSVLIIQFLKGRQDFGEVLSTRHLPRIKIEQFGTGKLIDANNITKEDEIQANKALDRARIAVKSREADMIILDEINVAIMFKMIKLQDVLDLLESKPKNLELVMTGRGAKPEVINLADYVTEMIPKKHPFESGQKAREGIEY